MQIFNVRFGLATNSSSSHSLIFLNEGVQPEDYHADGEFGWGHFTATSETAKLRYLAVLLRDRLSWELPDHIAQLVIRDWVGDIERDADDYIDHQSHYFLPSEFGTNLPDKQFFEAMKEYFLQPRLAILGGNDNTEYSHPLLNGDGFNLPVPQDCGYRNKFTCRYDEQYNFWTIFEEETGTKVRFRFSHEPKDMVPEKATAPELVDIKITNFCPFACDFCYQSSTLKGLHADMGYELYDVLKELKVFEVALGGGEPTLHPSFVNILSSFRDHGIVPNFTTRNLGWLRKPKLAADIMEKCGAFAFSAGNEKEIQELRTLVDHNEISHNRVNIHFVMGTIDSKYTFNRLLKQCHDCGFRATLLGYKPVGFGENFNPASYNWWLNEVKELKEDHRCPNIAVDTVLAAQYEQEILAADVPSYLFSTKDGNFSCYIDMVEQKVGPSSYCDPSEMIPLEQEIPEDQREGWRRYREMSDVIKDAFASF